MTCRILKFKISNKHKFIRYLSMFLLLFQLGESFQTQNVVEWQTFHIAYGNGSSKSIVCKWFVNRFFRFVFSRSSKILRLFVIIFLQISFYILIETSIYLLKSVYTVIGKLSEAVRHMQK